MEEYANEKIQENPKVETEEEVKRVVVNFLEEEEINPEISSSKDIDVLQNSVKESNETNLEEVVGECKVAPLENLGVTKDEENKNKLRSEKDEHSMPSVDEFDSVVEVSVENSKDSEVSEAEAEEIEEKVTSLDEINGIASNVNDVVLNGDEETPFVPQSLDESDKGESQVVSNETNEIEAHPNEEKNDLSSNVIDVVAKEIEETNLPSLYETCDASPSSTDAVSKKTDEKALQSPQGNVAVSSVSADGRSRGTEVEKVLHSSDKSEDTSHSVDARTVENVEDPSKPVANAPGIQSNDGFPESVGNTPIISLRQRTVQPTSWRSCCGLFEVLRRSDR